MTMRAYDRQITHTLIKPAGNGATNGISGEAEYLDRVKASQLPRLFPTHIAIVPKSEQAQVALFHIRSAGALRRRIRAPDAAAK